LERINPGGGRHLGAIAHDHHGSGISLERSVLSDGSRLLAFEWGGTGGSLPVVLQKQRAYFRERSSPGRCDASICVAQIGAILPKQDGPVPAIFPCRVSAEGQAVFPGWFLEPI